MKMSKPIAYEPTQGQKYQILIKDQYGRTYEHLDYAVDKKELIELTLEYRVAYHGTCQLKNILLPKKYWPKKI